MILLKQKTSLRGVLISMNNNNKKRVFVFNSNSPSPRTAARYFSPMSISPHQPPPSLKPEDEEKDETENKKTKQPIIVAVDDDSKIDKRVWPIAASSLLMGMGIGVLFPVMPLFVRLF